MLLAKTGSIILKTEWGEIGPSMKNKEEVMYTSIKTQWMKSHELVMKS
jgi:hypothetical protein